MSIIVLVFAVFLSLPGQPDPNPAPVSEEQTDRDQPEIQVHETTTVSKKAEPKWTAPGVVSSVDAEEISVFGPASVRDIWALLPGVQNTHGTGINRTSVRGGDPNASINHVLILVDGRPVRTSGGNLSSYSPPYTFPTLQIDHIEVSRGPGSVMHGANAMEGVINIVTRKAEGSDFRAMVEGGSFGTRRAELSGSYNRGHLSITAGALFSDIDGWDFTSAALIGEGRFTKEVFEENRGYHTNIRYKNFTFSGYHGAMKQFALLALQDNDPLSFNSQVSVFDLGYDWQIGDWLVKTHFTQNHEIFEWAFSEVPVLPFKTNDWLAEVIALTQFGPVDFTGGVVVQRLDSGTGGGVVSTPYQGVTWLTSAYGQFQYSPIDHLDLTLGLQLNRTQDIEATVSDQPADIPEDFETDIVPRLGLVWHFNPNSSGAKSGLKALFGEAYRDPSLLEIVIDTPGVQRGNPNLTAETIRTWDLQLFRYDKHYEISLAAYQSTEKNLIIFRRNPEYVLGTAANVARLESEGIELETKYKPNNNWHFQFTHTWQDNEEKTGQAQASLLPSVNWKLGLAYQTPRLNVGLFNQHDGAYKESPNPNIPMINPDSEAVDLISANLNYRLMSNDRGDLDINLKVNNLLDEEIWVTDFLGGAANSVPGGPGIAWYANIRYIR